MFVKVQEEIERACYNCNVVSIEQGELYNIYGVDDGGDQIFVVSYNKIEDTAVCDCKKFVREGLLCCHIFVLFKQFKWDDIPKKYVVSRWTRAAHLNPLDGVGDPSLERLVNSNDCKNMTNQMISNFYACVAAVEGNMDKMHILMRGMKELKDVLVSGDAQAESNSLSKSKLFELLYGCSRPDEVLVNPPIHVKTKGSGSRIPSRVEKSIRVENKPLRLCSNCQEKGRHDARNCPQPKRS